MFRERRRKLDIMVSEEQLICIGNVLDVPSYTSEIFSGIVLIVPLPQFVVH